MAYMLLPGDDSKALIFKFFFSHILPGARAYEFFIAVERPLLSFFFFAHLLVSCIQCSKFSVQVVQFCETSGFLLGGSWLPVRVCR